MIYSALDSIEHAKEGLILFDLLSLSEIRILDIPTEIDEYLCYVVFQIYIGQINRPVDTVHDHLRKIYLKNKKEMKIYQLLNVISSSDRENKVCGKLYDYFYG
jgi:hypothetical protein